MRKLLGFPLPVKSLPSLPAASARTQDLRGPSHEEAGSEVVVRQVHGSNSLV